MRYSTIFVAAFAAGAMARAVPGEAPPTEVTYPEETEKYPKEAEKYPKEEEKYPKEEEKYPKEEEKYPPKKDDKYPPPPKKDDKYPPKKDDDYEYAPVKKNTYEDKKAEEGDKYKPYFPPPKYEDEKKSPYGKLEWPTNVKADKPCDIKWGPKKGDWKEDEETIIYLYKCDDYEKPYEKVCDSCGKGEHKEWKPKKDCKPSNSEGGATYRFKFCKKSDEKSYTWGEEFPIWNDHYFEEKPEEKPVENQCPPPAPVPVKEEKPAPPPAKSPEEKPAPPAYPPTEASSPIAAGNETAPVPEISYNGSGAVRASISVIVGVAALVTFAL